MKQYAILVNSRLTMKPRNPRYFFRHAKCLHMSLRGRSCTVVIKIELELSKLALRIFCECECTLILVFLPTYLRAVKVQELG